MQYDRIFHEVNNFPQKMRHAQELKHIKNVQNIGK